LRVGSVENGLITGGYVPVLDCYVWTVPYTKYIAIVRVALKPDTKWVTIELMMTAPDPNLSDQASRKKQLVRRE